MKKILLILSLFIININVVLAESNAYLSSLNIEGYNISPTFNKYNNSYSVNINKEDTSLKINYTLEDENSIVEILDNDLITEDEHVVTIKVTNEEEVQTYRIYVNKETVENVINASDYYEELNIPKKFNKKLTITLIFVCWLLLVLIFKYILFGHKRKKYN